MFFFHFMCVCVCVCVCVCLHFCNKNITRKMEKFFTVPYRTRVWCLCVFFPFSYISFLDSMSVVAMQEKQKIKNNNRISRNERHTRMKLQEYEREIEENCLFSRIKWTKEKMGTKKMLALSLCLSRSGYTYYYYKNGFGVQTHISRHKKPLWMKQKAIQLLLRCSFFLLEWHSTMCEWKCTFWRY